MKIDFNCDLAEGLGVEQSIMPHISSANISCALHAGSLKESASTIALAKSHGVRIGAHPSFDDRANFGRTNLNLSKAEIRNLLAYQLGAFLALCDEAGAKCEYVKPHGALYNMAAKDYELAFIIADFVAQLSKKYGSKIALMGLSNSQSTKASKDAGVEFISEVFGDRAYTDSGALVPRSEPGAIIKDEKEAIAQVISMVKLGKTKSLNGSDVRVVADSLCIHGDGQKAVEFVLAIKAELDKEGIKVG